MNTFNLSTRVYLSLKKSHLGFFVLFCFLSNISSILFLAFFCRNSLQTLVGALQSIFLSYTHIHLHILKSLYRLGHESLLRFTFSLFHCPKVKFTTSLVFYFKSSLLERLVYFFHIYIFYFIFNLFSFFFIISLLLLVLLLLLFLLLPNGCINDTWSEFSHRNRNVLPFMNQSETNSFLPSPTPKQSKEGLPLFHSF